MSAATCLSTTPAGRHLAREQVEFFDREGYLAVEGLLDDADLQPVIDEISAEIDRRSRGLVAEGKLSRPYDEYGFKNRLAKIHAETETITRGILSGNLNGPAFFNLITNSKILDVIESVCGPELIASGAYRLRPKIPKWDFGAVPWHQDSAYFEPFCDSALIVTIWIALVDATAENGCMWVMPGMHRNPRLIEHVGASNYVEILESNLPLDRKVCVPLKKGGVLLMSNRIPHASFANTTDDIRWSMDLRFQSAALLTNAKISKLPGDQLRDEGAGIPVACNPPEPEFLVRSQKRPNEVLGSVADFQRLRREHKGESTTRRWKPGPNARR